MIQLLQLLHRNSLTKELHLPNLSAVYLRQPVYPLSKVLNFLSIISNYLSKVTNHLNQVMNHLNQVMNRLNQAMNRLN